jgi:glycosyltransferase involved in cell wall biosynthesis
MAAADLIVHFSDSEASNSVIKEAGLLEKRVAVCRDVGDFDDYIRDGVEGFVMDKEDPCPDFQRVVRSLFESFESTSEMGIRLKKSVLQNFSVEHVIHSYTEVIKE